VISVFELYDGSLRHKCFWVEWWVIAP